MEWRVPQAYGSLERAKASVTRRGLDGEALRPWYEWLVFVPGSEKSKAGTCETFEGAQLACRAAAEQLLVEVL